MTNAIYANIKRKVKREITYLAAKVFPILSNDEMLTLSDNYLQERNFNKAFKAEVFSKIKNAELEFVPGLPDNFPRVSRDSMQQILSNYKRDLENTVKHVPIFQDAVLCED